MIVVGKYKSISCKKIQKIWRNSKKNTKKMVERQSIYQVKVLDSDQGGEYNSKAFIY